MSFCTLAAISLSRVHFMSSAAAVSGLVFNFVNSCSTAGSVRMARSYASFRS